MRRIAVEQGPARMPGDEGDRRAHRITLELPGVSAAEVQVTAIGGVLEVTAEREADRGRDPLWAGLRHGLHRRTFYIPEDVDPGRIEAALDGGVLAVILPRAGGGTVPAAARRAA